MDLNNITLSPFMVANLYQNSLIESGNAPGVSPVEKSAGIKNHHTLAPDAENQKIKFLGENKKSILVLVKNPGITHLPDEDLTFLTGILNACKLTLADVAIINYENKPEITYQELSTTFSSRSMLLFDVDPQLIGLPMILPLYQILSFAGNSFLYSPSLKELTNDKAEKTKLWASLKRLFNI